MTWTGIILLGVGFGVAFLFPSLAIWASALLSAGLLLEVAGLLGRRLEFWAGVYAKDRPKTARRVQKPGP